MRILALLALVVTCTSRPPALCALDQFADVAPCAAGSAAPTNSDGAARRVGDAIAALERRDYAASLRAILPVAHRPRAALQAQFVYARALGGWLGARGAPEGRRLMKRLAADAAAAWDRVVEAAAAGGVPAPVLRLVLDRAEAFRAACSSSGREGARWACPPSTSERLLPSEARQAGRGSAAEGTRARLAELDLGERCDLPVLRALPKRGDQSWSRERPALFRLDDADASAAGWEGMLAAAAPDQSDAQSSGAEAEPPFHVAKARRAVRRLLVGARAQQCLQPVAQGGCANESLRAAAKETLTSLAAPVLGAVPGGVVGAWHAGRLEGDGHYAAPRPNHYLDLDERWSGRHCVLAGYDRGTSGVSNAFGYERTNGEIGECVEREGVLSTQGPDLPGRWALVSAAFSGSPWHVDPFNSSAWNKLLRGRKLWAFRSPKASWPPHTEGRDYAALEPDTRQAGLEYLVAPRPRNANWGVVQPFRKLADPFEYLTAHPPPPKADEHDEGGTLYCQTRPEDLIYVPASWWHMVLNTEDSVALTENFVPAAESDGGAGRAAALGELAKRPAGSKARECYEQLSAGGGAAGPRGWAALAGRALARAKVGRLEDAAADYEASLAQSPGPDQGTAARIRGDLARVRAAAERRK